MTGGGCLEWIENGITNDYTYAPSFIYYSLLYEFDKQVEALNFRIVTSTGTH